MLEEVARRLGSQLIRDDLRHGLAPLDIYGDLTTSQRNQSSRSENGPPVSTWKQPKSS